MTDLFVSYDPYERAWKVWKETDEGTAEVATLHSDGEIEDKCGRMPATGESWHWLDPR